MLHLSRDNGNEAETVHGHKPTCRCCKSKVLIPVLILLGSVLAIPSCFFRDIFSTVLTKRLVLLNNTQGFANWKDPPAPVYMTYTVFNYTNVQDVLLTGSKPVVVEVGPYVYREIRINEVVDRNDYNITYMQNSMFVYDQSASCGSCSEHDVVFSPSIVTMMIANVLHDNIESSVEEVLVNIFMNTLTQVSLFKRLTVREVIWGYEDPLLKMVRQIEGFLKSIGVVLPPVMSDVVALQLNGTAGMMDAGNFTCLTGKSNIEDIQKVVGWRGIPAAPYWRTKYGGMLNGTDGTRAPPFTSREDRIYMFVSQLCRSLYVVYSHDVAVKRIPTFQFTTTPALFANVSVNPDNIAFCSKKKCWGSGLLPISECRGGAPIFMSAPHFYQGDPKYVEAIGGMQPNATLHRTYVNIEPITGLVVEAHKRLQINVMVKKSFLDVTKPLQKQFNILPIMFADESVVIDESSARMLHDSVVVLHDVVVYSQYVLLALGGGLVLYSLTLLVFWVSGRHERMSYQMFVDDAGSVN